VRPLAACASALAAIALAQPAGAAPHLYVVPDGARISAAQVIPPAEDRGRHVDLAAVRGETIAFQVVLDADPGAVPSLDPRTKTLELHGWTTAFSGNVFVERFVDVRARSRNERGPGALGFTEAGSPPDEEVLGRLPDALLSPDQAARAASIDGVPPGERLIAYVEVFVPRDAAPGRYTGSLLFRVDATSTESLAVELLVMNAELPYRAVPMHAYYERETLERYFVDPDRAERELVRTLHAHQLDTLVQLTKPEHVERVMGALDGSWFEGDYVGPGRGVPASVVALGTYGTLGEPGPAALDQVALLASRVPPTAADVFVYAIDEQCQSPRGPSWRALLREADLFPRVRAGHTCHEDPSKQDVDLVMIPAQSFDPESAERARAQGKRVWIYNGMLPYSGAPVLDVPPTSLTVNGWIAASFDVGRWFYWETIFWEDHNRGGRGPTDVFVNPETFHNADGDTSLYDGMLVYPGRLPSAVGTHDLGFDGVAPSLRLKALRRGIEDAGLIALAAQVDPERTDGVVRRVVRRALDEVEPRDRTGLVLDAGELAAARDELYAIIASAPTPPSPQPADVARGLASIRGLRKAARERSRMGLGPSEAQRAWVYLALPCLLFAFGLGVARARKPTRKPS
jgi:hypothetical protein